MAAKKAGRPAGRKSNGEGSVYWVESKQRYVGAITVGLADGKPIRRTVTGHTRKDVTDRLAELARESANVDLSEREPTVAELAEYWIESYLHSGTQVSTTSVKVQRVRKHVVNSPIAGIRVRQLTTRDVERWLWNRGDYTRRTLGDIRGDLSQIMRFAVGRRIVERNVVEYVKLPADTKPPVDKRSLPPAVAQRLIEQCRSTDIRYGTFILACITLGARPGEIAALRWDDLDLDAGTVHIRAGMKRVSGGRPVVLGPTKTSETRKLRMVPELIAAFRSERRVQAELRLAAGPLWSTQWEGLVFLGQLGKPPHMSNLRRSFRSIMRDDPTLAPFADFTVYELRHSYASLLIDQGVPPHTVKDALGHVDLRMIERHYRHRLDDVIDAPLVIGK